MAYSDDDGPKCPECHYYGGEHSLLCPTQIVPNLKAALHDLLVASLSEDETRLLLVVTGNSAAVESEHAIWIADRVAKITAARARARELL